MSARLPERASVVVVGGGVMGVSTAFHLAEAGVTDVLLLDRAPFGSGSTCKSAGGVRAQFSDEVNIRLGMRGLECFRDFRSRPGQEIDLHEVGYLFLLTRHEDVAAFEESIRLQNELGVPTKLLDRPAVQQLVPFCRTDDVLAGAYHPRDGHCTPESVVLGYATAARRLGATLLSGVDVLDVEVRSGRITQVVTDAGTVSTDTVVCCAGAWSAAIGSMVGVDLPVRPVRRQVLFTTAPADAPDRLPMTIDFATSFYLHREGSGLLMGVSRAEDPETFDTRYDDAWLPDVLAAGVERVPSLADVGVTGGWAGLYEVTPDHNALIGAAGAIDRFLYATGFSGHGFLQGPAVGETLRDLFLGTRPGIDVSALSADRFLSDASRPEHAVV